MQVGYQTAVEHLQYLPTKQQKMVFDIIENLFELTAEQKPPQTISDQTWQAWLNDNQAFIDKLGFDIGDNPSERQKSFLKWEVHRQKMIAEYDDNEMTDDEFDALMASLRDKNDTGREVSFE